MPSGRFFFPQEENPTAQEALKFTPLVCLEETVEVCWWEPEIEQVASAET